MTLTPLNLCMSCKRLDRQTGSCPEFPDGIPEDIWSRLGDHHVSRAGERTYLPDPARMLAFDAWRSAVEVRQAQQPPAVP